MSLYQLLVVKFVPFKLAVRVNRFITEQFTTRLFGIHGVDRFAARGDEAVKEGADQRLEDIALSQEDLLERFAAIEQMLLKSS